MVRANPEFALSKNSLEHRFPHEIRLLKMFIEKSAAPTGEERTRVRKAFRDVGLFDTLNQEREKSGEDLYERVADVSWLEIAIFTEKRLQEEEETKRNVNEKRLTRLKAMAERDAEEEMEAEAIRVERPEFALFEPMSRGPEEKRKWYKQVPYEYLPMNRKQQKTGAPTEIKPEDYQRLKKERSTAISELFAKNLEDQRKNLAKQWLQKKFAGIMVSDSTMDRALFGERVSEISSENVARAWSAADTNMDSSMVIRQRYYATMTVDHLMGWRKIAREKIKKPRTGKKNES